MPRRLAVALDERTDHLVRRHRRHVLVEDGEFLRDLVGQEVGVGSRDLRHLDEERTELVDHLRDDLRLRAEVLRISLEEGLDVADRADLPAHDRGVRAHLRGALEQLVELPLIEAPACLEQVDDLDQQRLVGAQHEPHHVQRQLAEALELGRREQLVEELPELVDQRLRHRHRAARNDLLDDEADQVFRRLLVRNQPALAQRRRQTPGLREQRVLVEAGERTVDRERELFARAVVFLGQQLEQRHEAFRGARRRHAERRQVLHQPARLRRGCGWHDRRLPFRAHERPLLPIRWPILLILVSR